MGCSPALLARVALFFSWVSTPLVARAFHGGWLLPLLGIVFLPMTALAYVVVYALGNGVTGGAWLWVVLAFLFDVTIHGTAVQANRRKARGSAVAGSGSPA
jgi:hypothetical protein